MEIAVIGAGPVGLMLAAELRLGGAEVVVLDRRAAPDQRPRANGLAGRIVEQLDHRGLLDRFRAEAAFAGPVPGFPFGPVPLTTPVPGLMLQQPRLEALLTERALELGAEIRRGHELVGLDTVRGPDGEHRLDARYVVGCDGAHSRVRELAGIGFPGTTDGELMRLGHFRGDLPLFGFELARGWNRRPGGRVLVTSPAPGVVIAGVREVAPEPAGEPTPDEFRDAVRRVLGRDLPLGEPLWLSRTIFGELAAFPDAARHLGELLRDADELPYVPDLPLTVGGEPTRVAEIMRAARTVLFDFADRADLREAAGPGVKIVTADCPDAPADALLVRPDGVVTFRGGDPAALRKSMTREAMTAPGR